MARSFGVPGDYNGQQSNGFRWPFGRVGLITPFNFPLEIPALQLMGALYMGNKPLLHCDHRWGVTELHAFSGACSRRYSRAAAVISQGGPMWLCCPWNRLGLGCCI